MNLDAPALNALVAAVTTAALALVVLSLMALRRTKQTRFAWVMAAFGVLFIRGLAVSAGLFLEMPWSLLFALTAVGDALLVLFLYLAIIR